VYETEDSLIPKNTSVIVARVPVIHDKKKSNNGAFGPPGTGLPFHQRHLRSALPATSSAPAKAIFKSISQKFPIFYIDS